MDEGAPELTHALDAYLAASADAGAPPPGDPLTDAALGRLDADLAPQKLPGDLRVVWTRFQVAMLLPFPRLIPARLAMEMRSEVGAGHAPAALLPVGYESQVELCVDLTAPAGAASRWRTLQVAWCSGFQARPIRSGRP